MESKSSTSKSTSTSGTQTRSAADENLFMAQHELKDAADAVKRGDYSYAAKEVADAAKFGGTAAKDAVTGSSDRVPPDSLAKAQQTEAQRAGTGGGGGGGSAAIGSGGWPGSSSGGGGGTSSSSTQT